MILFKHSKYAKELENAPRILRSIIFDFDKISKEFGIDLVVTRILGTIKGDSGVHADYRAVDIRDEFGDEFTYNEDQRLAIFHFINAKYPRNDGKLTCIRHKFRSNPYHFHIQIPFAWKHLTKYSDIRNVISPFRH